MDLIEKIKRKELVSFFTLLIIFGVFLFVVFIFGVYKVSFKEYFKGFKTSIVTTESDMKDLTVYNSTVLKSKEVYSTDYTYEIGGRKDRRVVTLYIAFIGEQPVYVIKNLKKIDKEGENFVFKGTLRTLDEDFEKVYKKLPQDLKIENGIPIFYLDTEKNSKVAIIFQLLIAYVVVPFFAYLLIKKTIKMQDYRKGSSYENLMKYGNHEELINIIENEEIIEKSKMSALVITENWYVIPHYSSLSFVPKNMIVGFCMYTHSQKSYNSIHLYLIDGTIEVIQIWKKTSVRIMEMLEKMAIHMDHLDKPTYNKVKELHEESEKTWKAYEEMKSSIYNDLSSDDENNVPNKIRKQFMELVK